MSLIAGSFAMVLSMPLMSMTSAGGMERMKDPLMSWNIQVLDPVLRRGVAVDVSGERQPLFAGRCLFLQRSFSGGRDDAFTRRRGPLFCTRPADMNTLVALGTGAAFLYSAASTIAPKFFVAHGIAPDVYFEAAILIIGLVLTGNALGEQSERTDCERLAQACTTAAEDRNRFCETGPNKTCLLS